MKSAKILSCKNSLLYGMFACSIWLEGWVGNCPPRARLTLNDFPDTGGGKVLHALPLCGLHCDVSTVGEKVTEDVVQPLFGRYVQDSQSVLVLNINLETET